MNMYVERPGWWKFHRKIWNNPLLSGKRGREKYLSVWVWMLSEAQHSLGKSILFKGRQVYLKKGQFTCGSKQISLATGVNEKTVNNIRKKFVLEGMIEEQTSNQYSLITIVNWDRYQNDDSQKENLNESHLDTTTNQESTTEELKNVDNEKEVRTNPFLTPISLKEWGYLARKKGWFLFYGQDQVYIDDSENITLKCHTGNWLSYSGSLKELTWKRKTS